MAQLVRLVRDPLDGELERLVRDFAVSGSTDHGDADRAPDDLGAAAGDG